MAKVTRTEQLALLRATLRRLDPQPVPDFDAFAGLFRERSVRRGEVLVRAGELCDSVALVASGVARMYYTRGDGKEFIKAFVSTADFSAVLEALITGERSRLTIEALTPMQLLVAPYAALDAFCERDVYWQRIVRRIVERVYVKKARREAALLMDSAADRYRAFVTEHAALSQTIADYQIAAYLGITPEALSRLKRAQARSRAS